MQETDTAESSGRMIAVLPFLGSFSGFVKSTVSLAGILKLPVRFLALKRFFAERPQKRRLYETLIEEESRRSRVLGEICECQDVLDGITAERRSGGHLVAIAKEDPSFSTKDFFEKIPGSITVIPEAFKGEYRRVFLTVSGGETDERVLEIARTLGENGRCQLGVLVLGTVSVSAMRKLQARVKRFFEFHQLKAKQSVLSGYAKDAVLKACESGCADLLVLGGVSGAETEDFRSRFIAQAIVGEEECPVLIVK